MVAQFFPKIILILSLFLRDRFDGYTNSRLMDYFLSTWWRYYSTCKVSCPFYFTTLKTIILFLLVALDILSLALCLFLFKSNGDYFLFILFWIHVSWSRILSTSEFCLSRSVEDSEPCNKYCFSEKLIGCICIELFPGHFSSFIVFISLFLYQNLQCW